ncbi:MBL fold metallo-hydrolase, partial [Streptomyces sp. URMC 123]|uniref:MBL fold metallo-hydrolase n=1 Tax=Streptomyces sp. URMC 123 TaxID=3423403 RepID=UPI003F19E3EE
APVIRGTVPGAPPVLLDWERPLYAEASAHLPPAPPTVVDQELHDGDVLGFGGGARVVAAPGHTPGSIGVHLPEAGVLFTGDCVAEHAGAVILGVFNIDRRRALEAFHTLAAVAPDTVCFGHGDPVVGGAAAALRQAADGASAAEEASPGSVPGAGPDAAH